MDPALCELYEESSEQDEVSVILRLEKGARIPPGVREVARFGRPEAKIVTGRCLSSEILRIHDSEEVASMKAPRGLAWEEPYDGDDGFAESPAGPEATSPLIGASAATVPEDGSGVIVGICDWGFDFTHENFRNPDGTTRLLALWDQGGEGSASPQPYGYGREYTTEEINNALRTPDPTGTLGYHPSKADPRGNGAHGTHVADILAGNRREPGSEVGLASASQIIFVHLAGERMSELANFGDSVRLLEALDYVRNRAGDHPLVVNLSAGMTGGPHNETTLFTQALDALLLERPGIALGQSVGNYAESRMAAHGRLRPGRDNVLHWLISPRDRTPNELEVWYSGHDRFDLTLVAPSGARFSAPLGENLKLVQDGMHWGTLYHRRHEPNSGMNHIDIFLRTASPSGHYRVELHGGDVLDGRFWAWIERDSGGPHQSHFPRWQASSRYTTNTICNSLRGIAVGAYDATAEGRPETSFTSRGPTLDGRQKPEIAARGYRIRAARSLPAGGWGTEPRLTVKSGTSMAAPEVTGTMALMFQAAGRPLSITEVRRLLIGTADPILDHPGHTSTRLGYGYLNTVAAVEAARQVGRQGLPEAGAFPAHEAPDEPSVAWAPRWVVDLQPFEQHGENTVAFVESSEEPSGLAPGPEDRDVPGLEDSASGDNEGNAVIVDS